MAETVVRRALVSVYDKEGVTRLARELAELGVEIVSTGTTARTIREDGVAVVDVSEFTGSPEMMNGRVKTLHPAIHGGILCRRDNPDDMKLIHAGVVRPIDLVVCNLYPFQETVAKPGVSVSEAIEQIDIGGPTMVRAAAKNHAYVGTVVSPDDYDPLLEELKSGGRTLSEETRRRLCLKAFRHTAEYDAAIERYLSQVLAD